ncbi:MAG: hypothetical protein R6X02_32125 [Enhygromyxa sp.]
MTHRCWISPKLALLTLALVACAGCKNRHKGASLAELSPPRDAPAWESRYGVAFDDSYTPTSVNLQGRAPNDVLDQQLFQARLGHAAIVVLVRVEQVWGKGRYQGRQSQYLELELGEVLLGTLPKNTPEQLLLEVASTDELPGTLKDEVMLLFLRWDAESEPPYHHHLMPADQELIALIKAMVKHAQAEGVLDAKGDEKKGKRRRGRKNRKRDRDRVEQDPSTQPSSGASPSAPSGEASTPPGGDFAPDKPPEPSGPEPDSRTGLDKLGDEPSAADDTEPSADDGAEP